MFRLIEEDPRAVENACDVTGRGGAGESTLQVTSALTRLLKHVRSLMGVIVLFLSKLSGFVLYVIYFSINISLTLCI